MHSNSLHMRAVRVCCLLIVPLYINCHELKAFVDKIFDMIIELLRCYMMLMLTKLKMTSSLVSTSLLHTLISMLCVVGCGSVVQNHGGLLS